jgi:hypothetical protein
MTVFVKTALFVNKGFYSTEVLVKTSFQHTSAKLKRYHLIEMTNSNNSSYLIASCV